MDCWILMYNDDDPAQYRTTEPEIHGVVTTLEQAEAWRSKGYDYYTYKTILNPEEVGL